MSAIWSRNPWANSEHWHSRSAMGTSNLCSPSSLQLPDFPNLKILSLDAAPRANWTFEYPYLAGMPTKDPIPNLDFCNITITYTHQGWDDVITTTTFLPTKNWNSRFEAHGGAGFMTGGVGTFSGTIMPSLAQGFAVSTTDGGHLSDFVASLAYSIPWAFASPGNINWPLLIDFAYQGIHEMGVLAKSAVEAFYGEPPKYSYFYGGSTGGRQSHMLAQRYPEDFDGILALYPAINWNHIVASTLWTMFIMDREGVYPAACEMEAITAAAVEACDTLDGVEDGIISYPGACHFDPQQVVGRKYDCDGVASTISSGAATVAKETWAGPHSACGKPLWFGYSIGANISGIFGAARTTCQADEKTGVETCQPLPFSIGYVWATHWVKKDPTYSLRNLTHEQFDDIVHAALQEYESAMETADPDLSGFKKAGGKIINWHGTLDQIIPVNGSVHYYENLLRLDPQAGDYYRFFLAPGISHTADGPITVPDMNKYIVDWVENGIAPDTLRQVGVDQNGTSFERNLCAYPKVQHYVGGDSATAAAFECV